MSASEKLRALENPWVDNRRQYLSDALPQIVAVVEAAEKVKNFESLKAMDRMDAALTALEEALS